MKGILLIKKAKMATVVKKEGISLYIWKFHKNRSVNRLLDQQQTSTTAADQLNI